MLRHTRAIDFTKIEAILIDHGFSVILAQNRNKEAFKTF